MTFVSLASKPGPRLKLRHGGSYVVCAKMGDRIVQPARARLIWAAQTAQAMHDLGVPTILAGSGEKLPIQVESPEGMRAIQRIVSTMYNVEADFDIRLLYSSSRKDEKLKEGDWEVDFELPRYVLPHASVVHTRDPRVVRKCVARKTMVIYEDHDEDYHVGVDPVRTGLTSPLCRAVIAITQTVAERLLAAGIPPEKIHIVDSGVNKRAFDRDPERATRWRGFLLQGGHTRVAVYTGGLHEERGIEHILVAASLMPDVMFVLAGGNETDKRIWLRRASELCLGNVKFFGYLPQKVVCELQQAADVVLLTRTQGVRSAITSPLKFFEYLASGTPIVASQIEGVDFSGFDQLAIEWYSPARPRELSNQIRRSIEKYGYKQHGHAQNIQAGYPYTWEERQKRILSVSGVLDD